MKRLSAVPLLLMLAFGGTTSQDLPDIQRKIRQTVDQRDYTAAITELQVLQTANEKAFASNNYDYLLARMAEKNGQLAVAMANYRAVASRDSGLKAYALAHMSLIARSTGNLMLERIYLNEILLFSPDSLIANSAILRLARNSFESENYGETIRILTRRISSGTDSQTKKSTKDLAGRENQALLAEAYFRSGQPDRAREIFTSLLDAVPNVAQPDDVALTAAKALDVLDAGGQNSPQLTEAEHLRRADIYQFNRDFAGAKLHFDALIANYPAGAKTADAMFQIGRGL